MVNQPRKLEPAVARLAKAAKDAPVRIVLELLPHHGHRTLSHLSALMVIRHAARLDSAQEPGRELLSNPEFLFCLAVDDRRAAFFDRDLVAALKRRAKISGFGDVF